MNHAYLDLIMLFEQCFAVEYNTCLIKGEDEPIYLPATPEQPYHAVVFAHGFFSSALHECAHWLLAGDTRREQIDYGYWYIPDGRTAQQQLEFLQAEIKPQALEWVLSLACGFPFQYSIDNLSGETINTEPFKQAVYQQMLQYLHSGLPPRAHLFCEALRAFYHTPTPTDEACIQETRKWIDEFVIKLNLCPFAKHDIDKGLADFKVSHALNVDQALNDLSLEVDNLLNQPQINTTLLIFPDCFSDFFQYLDFIEIANAYLAHAGYEEHVQLATFHPDYCFADTLADDVSNYTNRSPYPLLHLLREEQVEKAIAYYGDTATIPENNIRCLQQIGLDEVKKRAQACLYE